jgi:excisionase family DNA binding protein
MLVTIHTAALLLSSTPWTVRRLIWAKKIPAVKIGRRCLVDPLDLQAYIVKLKAAA